MTRKTRSSTTHAGPSSEHVDLAIGRRRGADGDDKRPVRRHDRYQRYEGMTPPTRTRVTLMVLTKNAETILNDVFADCNVR
ncbi:hypothetical protein DPMN_160261 [Dreissena polymorpha]|uniref:Uncharacterized protein n=1 Tax=Dreissena polymorpha TaxID=45954 RepID=A0A9D4INL4_DREPO|nr:hypothetical protein DPMN_160261 [Dreissena polymorpha]